MRLILLILRETRWRKGSERRAVCSVGDGDETSVGVVDDGAGGAAAAGPSSRPRPAVSDVVVPQNQVSLIPGPQLTPPAGKSFPRSRRTRGPHPRSAYPVDGGTPSGRHSGAGVISVSSRVVLCTHYS